MDRSHPFSKSIEILRVIGTLLVVLLHSQQDNLRLDGSLNSIVQISLSSVICTVAVPLFFFISGYLFSEGFSVDKSFSDNFSVYKRKIKSRFKSLVIPYFLWNVLVLIAFSVMFYFIKKEPIDFFLKEQGVYGVLWSYHGFPIDYSLWFVRDLIVLSLLYPIIIFIVKFTGEVGLMTLLILLLSTIKIPVDGLNTTSLFFFFWGSFMNMKYAWKGKINSNLLKGLIIISFLLSVVSVALFNNEIIRRPIIKIFDIISILILLSSFTYLYEKNAYLRTVNYSPMTFFIIAFHPIIIFCVKHLLDNYFQSFNSLLGYFFVFIISFALSYASYFILGTLFPKSMRLLTGGRK